MCNAVFIYTPYFSHISSADLSVHYMKVYCGFFINIILHQPKKDVSISKWAIEAKCVTLAVAPIFDGLTYYS